MTENEPPADEVQADDSAIVTKRKRSRDPELWIHRPIHKYRKKDHPDWRPDANFFAVADRAVAAGRTLLGYDRLYVFWQAIRNLTNVPGDAVEVGTYKGGSAYFIADAFRAHSITDLRFHVFDTFEGHPTGALTELDPGQSVGHFSETSYDDVREYLSPFPSVQFHRGDVLDTLPALPESTYRLVHLDTDLHLPTKTCLEYFESRLSPGGVVVLDDYSAKRCEGVKDAVDEHLSRSSAFQAWDLRTEQLMLVRR
jgi:hypothetical protein